jgi:hypothetical protein
MNVSSIRHPTKRATLVALALAFSIPPASFADPPSDLSSDFCYGCEQIGLLVGGGFGIPIFGSDDHEVDHTRIFGVFPRWSIGVTDPLARGELYEGNFDFGIEPLALFNVGVSAFDVL